MSVLQFPAGPSITSGDLPDFVFEAMEKVIEVYRKSADPQAAAEDFEAIELRVSDVVKETGREMLRGIIESRDDGATRLGRDGKPWYRVEPTRKEIMTSLGPVRYMRPRYRRDGEACALVPVDNSLGLVEDYMTRPSAYLAVTMMGHCTAREAESFFARMGGMTPSVSTLQRVTKALHKDLEKLGNPLLRALHASSAIPPAAVVAAVSLDGIMVPLRAGEDGRKDAAWREASCGTVAFHDADGERLHTIYLGRMPEAGKVSLKAEIQAEVAHIQAVRPDIKIMAIADAALNNWGFLETLSPAVQAIDFWHACEHLKTASDHAVPLDWYERYRHILRHDPDGVEKVIRAIRYLRDKATTGKDDIKRELAFFRKNRHRMRYRQLKDQCLPIGSGVVEAANKVLVTQRLKRSGMRWKIDGDQAVLTFRALIKSDRFDTAWEILMASITGAANDNQDTTAVTIAA